MKQHEKWFKTHKQIGNHLASWNRAIDDNGSIFMLCRLRKIEWNWRKQMEVGSKGELIKFKDPWNSRDVCGE